MLTHPWNKGLTNDTTAQRKIISSAAYRSVVTRDSGADDVRRRRLEEVTHIKKHKK